MDAALYLRAPDATSLWFAVFIALFIWIIAAFMAYRIQLRKECLLCTWGGG
eukprot:COSAG01_NODE_69887_length_260_cov_0.639752_1_plen_50_part_10